jgi:hypothetical protein
MKQTVLWCVVVLSAALATHAKQRQGLDPVQLAADMTPAILQVTYWGENGRDPATFNVEGTAFLVGRDGYFVTAAHVLERHKAKTSQLTVTIHQRDKNSVGMWFDEIEVDRDHDIALCRITGFTPRKEPKEGPIPKSAYKPITSLTISSESAKPAEAIEMIGYPLGTR